MALSDRSRKLVNTAILLFAFFGLWFIWSEVFPALRILDQVTLWHHTVTVDGEDKVLPITLASIGLALIYAVITVILARQLPAVLEIILLQYTKMSAGSRYTVTTLTNYAIVTTGIILVFQTIGADWSQLQWLVAALGVGIGFGLQEIVANFISGVIILFERPIRIGDVVTVGDTDGTVTRIRSRATTIRSWDGKELLVPNKEFITGRLLNWSLSDQATRIVLSVGIAYGSDVRLAMRLLEEAARENENVLDDPGPIGDLRVLRRQFPRAVAAMFRGLRRYPLPDHERPERGRQRQVQCRRHRHRLPAAGPAPRYHPPAAGGVAEGKGICPGQRPWSSWGRSVRNGSRTT